MKQIVLIITCFASLTLFSQIKGKVTYQVEIQKDSIQKPYENLENSDLENEVLEVMQESQPVESYLVFNDSVAIYRVEEILQIPKWNMPKDNLIPNTWISRVNFPFIRAGDKATYYSDLSRDYLISQNDLLGTTKRVEKSLCEWILTDETKDIDGYLCYKAIYKNKKVWYTQEIPISHGPKGLNGLPGLILEIDDGKFYWKAIKIDLENTEADEIIEPIEGELISEEEFAKLCGDPFAEN